MPTIQERERAEMYAQRAVLLTLTRVVLSLMPNALDELKERTDGQGHVKPSPDFLPVLDLPLRERIRAFLDEI